MEPGGDGILAWDVHALLHAPSRLFQAPIFHPLPDALAFSENLLLPAVLSAPGQIVSPVLGYNLALVISLVVSGLGVQALARRGLLAQFVGQREQPSSGNGIEERRAVLTRDGQEPAEGAPGVSNRKRPPDRGECRGGRSLTDRLAGTSFILGRIS